MGVKRSSGAARVEEQIVLEWKRYAARRARSADKVAAGTCFLESRPCPFEARPDFETRFVQDCVHCARLHGAAERTGVASPGSSGVVPTLPLLTRLLEEEGNGLAPSGVGDGEDGRWRAAAIFLRALPLLHASSLSDRTARILLAAIARAYEDVVDTILFGFDVPVEHGAVGVQAHLVRDASGVDPFLASQLVVTDDAAHALMENLGAASGHGIEAGFSETLQYSTRAELGALHEVSDLDHGESFQMHARETRLEASQHLAIPIERQFGM